MTTRYRELFQCARCGNRWKGPIRDCPAPLEGWPTPKCPNLACGETQEPRGIDLSLNKAPAQVGQSISVKAIDETAQIVMEDHKLTDLRTDVRPSETMTPKLPPQQQAAADSFFSAGKRTAQMRRSPAQLARAAIHGQLRDRGQPGAEQSALQEIHRNKVRVPTHFVADDRRLR